MDSQHNEATIRNRRQRSGLAGATIIASFAILALSITGCGEDEASNDKINPTPPSTSTNSPVTVPSNNPESFEIIAP